jgi:hypothetical protein
MPNWNNSKTMRVFYGFLSAPRSGSQGLALASTTAMLATVFDDRGLAPMFDVYSNARVKSIEHASSNGIII